MNNSPDYTQDTIVAAATPPGIGGIGIVRVSGPEAANIGQRIAGVLTKPRYATLAHFKGANGEDLDQGMAILFPAPHSFTGETVVEFHGHGGPQVLSGIVDAAVNMGARMALPGEFSKRAFLNNKLDLAQAEAIADLIGSGTKQATQAALRSLAGVFSLAVSAVQEQLTALRLHTEAALDFPEEEIDFLADDALAARIENCAKAFTDLTTRVSAGRILRDGFQMVIVGRPNAGKSSLLNSLSGQESAIVTEVAGTTRDILREQINIDGLAVELVDTAGIRNDPDRIEAEGIRRAREAIGSADAILWIKDGSLNLEEHLRDLEPGLPDDTPFIEVRNKTDLTTEAAGLSRESPPTVNISAKTGDGIEVLRDQIRRLAGYSDQGEGAFTARRRHVKSIETARRHFDKGRRALRETRSGEIFAEELRIAQQALGEITGSFTSDDLLGRIFSEFCIGK